MEQNSSSENEEADERERPPKQIRKEWLKHGQVPRSTLQRWEKQAREQHSVASGSTSDSSTSSGDDRNSNEGHESDHGEQNYGEDGVEGDDDAADDGGDDGGDDDGDDGGDDGDDGDGDDGGDDDDDGDGGNGGDINENIGNEENFEFMPELLFTRSPHTAGQAVIQVLQLYSKHAITKSCLRDLIKLIHNLLPRGNTFPSTYYFLQNNIARFIPPASSVEHVACGFCGFYLGKLSNILPGPCQLCGRVERVKFHEFSLGVLIKYLFEKRGLSDAIDAHENGPQSDVSNSEEYLRLKDQYPGRYDLILLWNTDGVKVRRSGPASLWELSITICNVPPQVRNKFTTVVGLWYADKKPKLTTFLTPFIASLSQLEQNGVRWTHPRTGEAHISQVVAPAVSVDAPVRGELQNIMQHDGEFSCHNCEIEGDELILGPRSRKRIYPVPDEPCPLRTKESMRLQADRAEAENVIVKGVKGTSLLESIPTCDTEKSIILDYLHLVLLGVVRQFFKLWFTGAGTDWYIGRRKRLVTLFLKELRRTYEVCRCPSDVSQWKLYKGSTWRTWLLFVSLPALKPFLKDKYFQHWMLLVLGMSILLQESISAQDLDLADHLLSLFVRDTQELYGYSAMTYNLHCLSHLVLVTRRWGAPWSVSAFKFENLNGVLSRLIHGTIHITTELTNTLNIITATNSIDYLMNEAQNIRRDPRVSMLSPVHGIILTDAERLALVETLADIDDVRYFSRAKIAGMIFTSSMYSAERATDNKHICYEMRREEHFGIVQFYVRKGQELYALVKKLVVEPDRHFQHTETQLIVNHIKPVQITDVLTVIRLSSISCKVFRIGEYVCKELNRYEHAL